MMKGFLLELEIVLNGIDGKILDNNSVTSMRKVPTEGLSPMGVSIIGFRRIREDIKSYRSKSNKKRVVLVQGELSN